MNKVPKEDKKSLRQNTTILDVVERLKASDCVACGLVEQDGKVYVMLTRTDRGQGRTTSFKLGINRISAPQGTPGKPDDVYVHIAMCEGKTGMVSINACSCAPDVKTVMDNIRSLLDDANKHFRLPKEHREMLAEMNSW